MQLGPTDMYALLKVAFSHLASQAPHLDATLAAGKSGAREAACGHG
jgi:hypothetical protein